MTTLLVPDLGRGHGTGHLRRCLKLLADLPAAAILIPNEGSPAIRGKAEFGDLLAGVPPGLILNVCEDQPPTVVLDLFDASDETVLQFGSATTIGLDIGGCGRGYCSYLVDTLLRLDGGAANLTDTGYLDLPQLMPVGHAAADRILVTFGGEDPAGLTEATVRGLVARLGVDPERLIVVRPGLGETMKLPAGVRTVGPLPSLGAVLAESMWVITSYGMTAFEAAAAGRCVVTVAPTKYHDQLAARAGFVRAGVLRPSVSRLRNALSHPEAALRVSSGMTELRRKSLPELIGNLHAGHRGCPAHTGRRGRAVWRGAEKSYFRCPDCGTVYLERFAEDEETYGASYFSDEYQAQYGKTYLEDFEAIKVAGHRRLNHVLSLKPGLRSLLDIGCAYGPFLEAAKESGLEPYGVDISEDAIRYVTDTLKLPAIVGSVLDADLESIFGRNAFDVVTLWYVIEHFANLDALLSRLSRWVRPGGILAIATPNLSGVSGKRSADLFFSESPRDHHTLWSGCSATQLLPEYGFRIRRMVSTGHHPERYPAVRRGVLPQAFALLHSRLFGWGDTFEIYAERENDE